MAFLHGHEFLDTERVVSALGVVEGMHIADLGCGSGYFTVVLAKYVGSKGLVTAVDVMTEPLEAVKARAEALGLGNIRTVRADLEILGGTAILENSQDIALLANVLFQSQKKEAIVREAVRMTKPGGRVVIIDWKKGVGSMGPPDNLRTAEADMQHIAEGAGLKAEGTLDAGKYYYALVFTKS